MAKRTVELTERDWAIVRRYVEWGIGRTKANFNPSYDDSPRWKAKCKRITSQAFRIKKAVAK